MPKIRCRGCEAVLNIPDQARGKSVACPKCKTRLKVPAGAGSAPAAKKRRVKKKAVQPTDSGDPFSALDLDDYDTGAGDEQICPYCAAELDEDDPVCRGCGMNVETGKMDAKEQKRRSRKGPDPAKFYAKAWGDSWEFLLREKGLAIRTGLYWTLFATLNALCAYMAFVYTERIPPKVFWAGMTLLTGLGIPGWYWLLGLKVIGATVLREEVRGDRIQFDFFSSAASGVRAIFWPLIVMGPVLPILLLLYFFAAVSVQDPLFLGALGLLLLGIPVLLLPLAMIHMTARYTYKGWIFWELIQLLFKNFAATLYFYVVAFVACLPVAVVAIPILLLIKSPNPFTSEVILGLNDRIVIWIMDLAALGADRESFTYMLIKLPFNILAAFLVMAPICFTAGFPALFLMRANGLLGLYNQRSLDLVNRMTPGTPATFWVRYLAHTIDVLFLPLASFLVTANRRALMLGWAINAIGLVILAFSRNMLPIYGLLWGAYMNWMYWTVQESSELRSTLGKDAFGLIIVTDDDKQLTMGQASAKWLLRNIFDFMLGIPYLMAAFHPKKKSPHDLITKTRVVWKGDR